MTLEKMFFANEIRPIKEIKPKSSSVAKGELEMAERLIDHFTGKFKPEKYKDTYTAALKKIVKAKQQGKEVHATPEQREEQVPDLIEALRASLEARRGTGSGRTRTASSGDGGRKRRAVCKGTPSKARSRR